MKHLTKHEAIGRMMLAYATLIEEDYHCEMVWWRSCELCELQVNIYECDDRPQLPILSHPDFRTKDVKLEDEGYCIKYVWNTQTAAQ